MKTALCSLIISAIIVCLAGCGGGGDDDDTPEDTGPPKVDTPEVRPGKPTPGPPNLVQRCASANPPAPEVCFELIR